MRSTIMVTHLPEPSPDPRTIVTDLLAAIQRRYTPENAPDDVYDAVAAAQLWLRDTR